MKKEYQVVAKDKWGDWDTIADELKTKKEAMAIAKKLDNKKWVSIDIYLIIDEDLKETFDKNGKVR